MTLSPNVNEPELRDRIATTRERWADLAQTHIVVGGGCSCGHGMGHLDVGGFASLITAHLKSKYEREGRGTLASLLPAETDSSEPIARMLQSAADGALAGDDVRVMLKDLETALDSFDELHRGH